MNQVSLRNRKNFANAIANAIANNDTKGKPFVLSYNTPYLVFVYFYIGETLLCAAINTYRSSASYLNVDIFCLAEEEYYFNVGVIDNCFHRSHHIKCTTDDIKEWTGILLKTLKAGYKGRLQSSVKSRDKPAKWQSYSA